LLLFADDGKLTMPLSMWRQLLPIMLALFVVLDIPVKWEKVKGGFQLPVDWLLEQPPIIHSRNLRGPSKVGDRMADEDS